MWWLWLDQPCFICNGGTWPQVEAEAVPELHNTNAVVQHPNSLLDFLPLDPAHLSIFHTYFLFLVVLYLLRFASDRESCFHGLGLGAWAT